MQFYEKKTNTFFGNNILQLQAFPIAGIIASKRGAAKAADKVSPSVNYVHVKRIYPVRAHILSLGTFSHRNYVRTTRYSSPHSNDFLSRLLSLLIRIFHLSLPFSLSVHLSFGLSFSLSPHSPLISPFRNVVFD